MEKRAAPRHLMETSLMCTLFRSTGSDPGFEGRMCNCSTSGLCVELETPLKKGSAVVVRAARLPRGSQAAEGFRWVALAEVRWTRPRARIGERSERYATGLKYLAA